MVLQEVVLELTGRGGEYQQEKRGDGQQEQPVALDLPAALDVSVEDRLLGPDVGGVTERLGEPTAHGYQAGDGHHGD